MFKKLKNFICNLFNIKACQCEDEHIEYYTKVLEPDVPVYEEVKLTKPMHCGSHLRYKRSCPACVATKGN